MDGVSPIREAVIAFLQSCPKNREKNYDRPSDHDASRQFQADRRGSFHRYDQLRFVGSQEDDEPPAFKEDGYTRLKMKDDAVKEEREELDIKSGLVFETGQDERKSAFIEKNLLALEIERKARVQKANCQRRIRINKHLSMLREKAENDLAAKMESLALERKEDERQLEALSQKILDGQMRQSQQVATAIADQNDQSKRILDNLRMTKADNQRRELLNQASHALEKYHQCLARCEGIEVVESGFNLERMTSVMSEVSDADVTCLMESTAMLDALRGQINLCLSHNEALAAKHQQKVQQEAEKLRQAEEQLKMKEEQELRDAQARQQEEEKRAAEADRAKAEADAAAAVQAAKEAEAAQIQQIPAPAAAATKHATSGSPSVSEPNLQMLEALKSFKASVKAKLTPLDQDKSRSKFLCQKAVNTPVNAIGPHSSSFLKDKLDKLQKLMRGEPITIGTETVAISMNPLYSDYVKFLMAKKFAKQGEEVISSKPDFAFPMAAVIVALWAEFPDFGTLFLAHLYESCPYLVPFFPPHPSEPTKEEYLVLGYKYEDEDEAVIEKQDKFISRMTGYARLMAAVTISTLPQGQEKTNHPHGLGHLWRWLASTLNMDPKNDITASLLCDILEIAGSDMFAKFGANFRKLLMLLCQHYFPKIQQVTLDGSGGPVMRLEQFLEKAVKSGTIAAPAKALKPGFL